METLDSRRFLRGLPCRACCATTALLLWSSAAHAAPPKTPSTQCSSTSTTADADASAEELLRRGQCAEAERHFIAAVKLYQLALRRSPSPQLARRLQTRSSDAVARLASVRIEPGSLPEGASATIASKSYELGTKHYVDPGKVDVEVSAPGYTTRTVTFDLGEGEERVLTIVLTPETASAPVVGPPVTIAPTPRIDPPATTGDPLLARPPDAPAGTTSFRPVGYATLAVGGAALIVGAVTGVMTLGRASDVRRECPTKTSCSADGAAAARSGSTLSTVSTVTVIGGSILALAGLGLVIWGGPKSPVRASVGTNGIVVGHEL